VNQLQEAAIDCPYCGESITVLIDSAQAAEQYIEDCQVCCRPITFHLSLSENGDYLVDARHEDDA